MQWSAEKNAGFSEAEQTWLPVAPDFAERNAAAEVDDPSSYYSFYRKLIGLRRTMPSLCHGSFVVLEVGHPDVLCFVRTAEGEHTVALINFSDRPVSCIPGVPLHELLLSSELETKLADLRKSVEGHIELLPYEAAVFV
jgi:glycosidase